MIVLQWFWRRLININTFKRNNMNGSKIPMIYFYNNFYVYGISWYQQNIILSQLFWRTIVPWWVWWLFSKVSLFPDFGVQKICSIKINFDQFSKLSINITLNEKLAMVSLVYTQYNVSFCSYQYLLLFSDKLEFINTFKQKNSLQIDFKILLYTIICITDK